ncbi:hypothetical protein [Geotalea uraniireducens]|uniref:hypothetical protein n=1 Tax=Geotalea uraniireducens TaxID=351604 RepID=UPI0024911F4C|nr:hypothetical protein [Geotalea uraniireducens]
MAEYAAKAQGGQVLKYHFSNSFPQNLIFQDLPPGVCVTPGVCAQILISFSAQREPGLTVRAPRRGFGEDRPHPQDKIIPVRVIGENFTALNAATNDVVERASSIDPSLTGHLFSSFLLQ